MVVLVSGGQQFCESGLVKSLIMSLDESTRGAEEYERRNTAGVKFGCVRIVVKDFSKLFHCKNQ